MSLRDEAIGVGVHENQVYIYDDVTGAYIALLSADDAEELAHHIRWAVATIRYNEPGAEG